ASLATATHLVRHGIGHRSSTGEAFLASRPWKVTSRSRGSAPRHKDEYGDSSEQRAGRTEEERRRRAGSGPELSSDDARNEPGQADRRRVPPDPRRPELVGNEI